MSSQRSFQSLLGKFSAGLEILKGTGSYNPSKQVLTITALEALEANVTAKNAAVITAGATLKSLRNNRRNISFTSKDADTNCIENLIKNIASYIKAEIGKDNPAYLKINSIIKKINPPADKKEELKEGEEPKKSVSSSEKTYQSLVGFGNDVHTLILNLGAAYNPSNSNITVANFKVKVDELAGLNAAIVKAESDYATAVQERIEVYNGEAGINKIVPLIKDYLASFEGGKKNPDYTAFANAVK